MTVRRNFMFLIAVSVALAACNSITGTQPANAPVSKPVKQCIDDFRAVHILQPMSDVYAETRQLVVWDVVEFCSNWEADVAVSYDNQRTWTSCGYNENGSMMSWCVAEDCAGKVAWVKVTVRDDIGEVSDIKPYPILPKRHHTPQDYDNP